MGKADHSTGSTDPYEAIRSQAHRLLSDAGAYGRYPTPVADIIVAAKLSMERNASLDASFLKSVYGRVKRNILHAVDKVLGLFDSRDRRIYLDLTLKREKRRFVSLHETGHGYLPWQRDAYKFMEDGRTNLDPEVEQEFEQQASIFASEVLFQGTRFGEEAESLPFEIKTPMQMAARFGASKYAAFRRYVSESPRVCALLIFEQPQHDVARGDIFHLRRTVVSRPFFRKFGNLDWPAALHSDTDSLARFLPVRSVNRIFTRRCRVTSPVPGCAETFYLEAFDSSYHIFALLIPESELRPIRLATELPVARPDDQPSSIRQSF